MRTSSFNQDELERYSRQLVLPELGREGQEKLKKARVLVIGAGGLGCPSLQYLAAAGVGTIGIVDGDKIAQSNLHRQLLFNEGDIGRNKAAAAVKKLSLINPFIRLEAYPVFLEAANAGKLIELYDLVIDGSDNFSTRYLVNDACVLTRKPFIFAALHKFELQLTVFNLGEGPTYRCLYPHPPAEGEMPSCAEAGVIGVLPGLAGTLQATEAIKIITGIGQPLSGKLLIMNLLNNERQLLNLHSLPENRALKSIKVINVPCKTIELSRQTNEIPEIDIAQLRKWIAGEMVQLIDVRSPAEFAAFRLNKGEINLPLDQLEGELSARQIELADRGTPLVLLCQTGKRSQTAGSLLKAKNEHWQLFSLRNGLSGIQ